MQIIQSTLTTYDDAYGGGTNYPDLGNNTVLDWIERGTTLVVHLDCSEFEAEAIVSDPDNAEFNARIVPEAEATDKASEVNLHIWQGIRAERDRLLADGPDRITALRFAAMEPAELSAWQAYRQSLLDITEAAYPAAVVWPEVPGA